MITISVTQLASFWRRVTYVYYSVRKVSCLMVTMSMTFGGLLLDDNYICDSVGKVSGLE
jgi:hypothetical protein